MVAKIAFLAVALAVSAVHSQVVDVFVPATGIATFTSPEYPAFYGLTKNIIYNISGTIDNPLVFDAVEWDIEQGEDILEFTELIPETNKRVVIGKITRGYSENINLGGYRFRSTTNKVQARFIADGNGGGVNAKNRFKINVVRDSRNVLTATCLKGKMSVDQNEAQNTMTAVVSVDQTFACRTKLHAAHTWIVEQLPKPEGFNMRSAAVPVAVTCSDGKLKLSEEEPDNSTANELTFTTSGNAKCRALFANFLDQL